MESMFKTDDSYDIRKQTNALSRFILMYQNDELRYPEFQRDYVWSTSDRVALIESIFDGVEFGRILINERFKGNDSSQWYYEILDGRQRLTSILDYYNNKYKVRGYYYKDLSKVDQMRFRNILVSVHETKNLSEIQKVDLFIKVNTTGKVMDTHHIEIIKKKYLD